MKDKGSHLKWYGRLEAWFTRHRILATAPIAVLLIMLARPTLMLLVVGGALVVIGEISRIWASGYIDKNRELATAGPFQVRTLIFHARILHTESGLSAFILADEDSNVPPVWHSGRMCFQTYSAQW